MSRQGSRLLVPLVIGFALVHAGSAAARISTTPNSHDFGGQTAGTASAPFTFTLRVSCNEDLPNPGICLSDDPLTPNVTVSGNFAIRNNNCTAFMPGNSPLPGDSCTFGVAFVPPATGYQTGIVDVGDPGGFGKAGVSGTGLAPVLPVPLATPTTTPGPGPAKKKCKRRRGQAAAARKCKRKKR